MTIQRRGFWNHRLLKLRQIKEILFKLVPSKIGQESKPSGVVDSFSTYIDNKLIIQQGPAALIILNDITVCTALGHKCRDETTNVRSCHTCSAHFLECSIGAKGYDIDSNPAVIDPIIGVGERCCWEAVLLCNGANVDTLTKISRVSERRILAV